MDTAYLTLTDPTTILTQNIPIPTPKDHTMALIAEVAAKHDVQVASIMGRNRCAKVAFARAEAIKRIKDEKNWSVLRLAAFFKRDGSTVRHILGLRKMQQVAP